MKKLSVTLALFLLFSCTGLSSSNSGNNDIALALAPGVLFELTEAEVDSFLADMNGHTYLRPAGAGDQPVFGKDPDGGISITNRGQDWHCLDISSDWMQDGMTYNVVIELASKDSTHFKVTNTDAPYGVVLSGTASPTTEATLEYEMSYLNSTDGQRGVRITTHPQSSIVDYTVRNIIIYDGENTGTVDRTWTTDIPSLYQTYSDYFPIGNILEPAQLDNEELIEMYLHQYNTVTAENSMKPDAIARSKGEFNFANADRLVDWAVANNVQVHGHTLVWHSQSARWLNTDTSGQPLTRAQARENMEEYITGYANHFAGRVYSWDVVNEAFTDGVTNNANAWYTKLRTDSPWYRAYANEMDEGAGEHPSDYIYDAFVFTRMADPNALLFYNDFNEEQPGKRNAIAEMVEDLNARWLDDDRNTDKERLLIEVVGMQSHFWTNSLKPSDVRDSIERFIETGAKVAVTEIDIPTGSYGSFKGDDEEALAKQAQLYKELFEIYKEYASSIVRVTFWGKADHQSWRSGGYPLLFDASMQPKAAFYEIIGLVNPFEPITPGEPAQIDPVEPAEPADTQPDTTVAPAADTGDSGSGQPIWLLFVLGGVIIIMIPVIIVLQKKNKK